MKIAKSEKLFLPYRDIEAAAECGFSALRSANYLAGLGRDAFADQTATLPVSINAIHAFREGNGRTQRLFLDRLAARNGYAFEWAAISGPAMVLACREAREDPGARLLRRLIRLNTVLGGRDAGLPSASPGNC